jgi:hypothetical protein
VLPYGGMTRIRFKGFISLEKRKNCAYQTPSNGVKVLEKQQKSKVNSPLGLIPDKLEVPCTESCTQYCSLYLGKSAST